MSHTSLNPEEATKFLLASYTPLTHVSASAIQCFHDCERKFFDRYVLKEREPGTDATDLGTAIHDVLESYVRDGKAIDQDTPEGRIAAGALPYIPAPNTPSIACEISLDELPLRDPCALPFKGFIDLLDTRGAIPVLTDYKTSSNLKKYAKKPEELKTNLQLVIYATHVFDNYPCDVLELRHIYLQTKGETGGAPATSGPNSLEVGSKAPTVSVKGSAFPSNPVGVCLEVKALITREEAKAFFDNNVRPVVKAMLEASQGKASTLKKNMSFCFSYGQACSAYSSCSNPNREVQLSPEMQKLIENLKGNNYED